MNELSGNGRVPASARAIDTLRKRVGETPAGSRLPVISLLAQEAGVSYVVMARAVQALREEGLVFTRPGAGITAGANPPPRVVLPLRRRKWEMIRDRIDRDIIEGAFPPGTDLPSIKGLKQRYGVSYNCLRPALALLEKQNRVVRHRRGLRGNMPAGRPGHSRIVLIARGGTDGNLLLYSPRAQEIFRLLEGECSRTGILLEKLSFDEDTGRLYSKSGSTRLRNCVKGGNPVLGYLLWTTGISEANWTAVAEEIRLLKGRLSILDEAGDIPSGVIPSGSTAIRAFFIGLSVECGCAMGRYLLGLGHRRIACISPFHNSLWSRNRLDGLTQAFATMGDTASVTPFTSEFTVLPDTDAGPALSTMLDTVEGVRASLRSSVMGKGALVANAVRILHAQTRALLELEPPGVRLLPLFTAALKQREISAWVCANDVVARHAMEFLHGSGRRVPRDISVAGFDDDSQEYVQWPITSYNFNAAGLVRAMLAHVLEGGQQGAGGGKPAAETVAVGGYIVQRDSTAPFIPSPAAS